MSNNPGLDLANIQGNILRGYGRRRFGCARFVYMRVLSAEEARGALAGLAPRVTWADGLPEAGAAVNVAITAAGFRALGAPHWLMDRLPPDFTEGMARRAALLGDRETNSPENWDVPWHEGGVQGEGVHVLLSAYAESEAALSPAIREIVTLPGLACIGSQVGTGLADDREHFGFIDGFGQPDIEGVPREPPEATAAHRSRHRTGRVAVAGPSAVEPLKVGEVLLGYENVAGEVPPVRLEADADADSYGRYAAFMRDGTFMVYRVLEQHVERFRGDIERAATRTGICGDLLAARMVGRWRDGTPLMVAATCEAKRDLDGSGEPPDMNGFRYSDDPDGGKCPLGAHIRRANPRDSLGLKGRTVDRHRIVRRGIPFGVPYDDEPADRRGLVFIGLNASITGQFEIIQREWLNAGHISALAQHPTRWPAPVRRRSPPRSSWRRPMARRRSGEGWDNT